MMDGAVLPPALLGFIPHKQRSKPANKFYDMLAKLYN
jgi:hypothetical protein